MTPSSLVVLLFRHCVDESGNTQALNCMDQDVLVRHPASRLSASTVSHYSVPSCKKKLAACPLAKSISNFGSVTACLRHSSVCNLAGHL